MFSYVSMNEITSQAIIRWDKYHVTLILNIIFFIVPFFDNFQLLIVIAIEIWYRFQRRFSYFNLSDYIRWFNSRPWFVYDTSHIFHRNVLRWLCNRTIILLLLLCYFGTFVIKYTRRKNHFSQINSIKKFVWKIQISYCLQLLFK